MKRFILSLTIALSALMFPLLTVADTPIKIMTYNIMGTGISRKRIANIAQVINQNNPDVIAIQEVNNRNLSVL